MIRPLQASHELVPCCPTANEAHIQSEESNEQLIAIHEVLDQLALEHPAQAEVVKLRYFAGMTNEQTAEVLGVSVATVKNYWTFARAWIFHELKNP